MLSLSQFAAMQSVLIAVLMFTMGTDSLTANTRISRIAYYLVHGAIGLIAGTVTYHYLPSFFASGGSRDTYLLCSIFGFTVGTATTWFLGYLFQASWSSAWQNFKKTAGWE
jgi:hypothetical protein